MKDNEIAAKRKQRFKWTADSNHKLPVSPKFLNQGFSVDSPDEVWVSDITYIDTYEGWL